MVPTILTVTRIATVVDWDDASYTRIIIYIPYMQQSPTYIWASTKYLRDAWQSTIPNYLYIASQP